VVHAEQTISAKSFGASTNLTVRQRPVIKPQHKIFDQDTRIPITAVQYFPSSAIAFLEVTFPSTVTGKMEPCTGFFIGSNTVVTAAHCVYNPKTHQRAKWVGITPGQNDYLTPNGRTIMTRIFIRPEWTGTKNTTGQWVGGGNKLYDYAVIKTRDPLGDKTGVFDYTVKPVPVPYAALYNVRGYPAQDKPLGTMWNAFAYLNYVTTDRLWYKIDTNGGESGAPLYFGSTNSLIGIHTEGGAVDGIAPHPELNSAIRINLRVYNDLKRWSLSPN
jgi:glutamyl endopeptidase